MKTVILENGQLRIVELSEKDIKDLKKSNYFVENKDIIFVDKDYKKVKPYIYYLLNKYKYLGVEKVTKLVLLLSLFFIIIFGLLYYMLLTSIKGNYQDILDFQKEYIKNEKELIEKIKKELKEQEKKKQKQELQLNLPTNNDNNANNR